MAELISQVFLMDQQQYQERVAVVVEQLNHQEMVEQALQVY
jgi:hypothetical protein